MVDSFAHPRPWWWYLPWLPVVLAPWILWSPLWRAVGRLAVQRLDAGTRLCIAWTVPTFIVLSLVSGKQVYYLLPLFPALALIAARALCVDELPAKRAAQLLPALLLLVPGVLLVLWTEGWLHQYRVAHFPEDIPPAWGVLLVCLGVALLVGSWRRARAALPAIAMTGFATSLLQVGILTAPGFGAEDLQRVGHYLAQLEQRHAPLAHVGKYRGEFHFVGRLRRPLEIIGPGSVDDWLRAHPEGRVIAQLREPPPTRLEPDFVQPIRLRGRWVAIYSGPALHERLPEPAAAVE